MREGVWRLWERRTNRYAPSTRTNRTPQAMANKTGRLIAGDEAATAMAGAGTAVMGGTGCDGAATLLLGADGAAIGAAGPGAAMG